MRYGKGPPQEFLSLARPRRSGVVQKGPDARGSLLSSSTEESGAELWQPPRSRGLAGVLSWSCWQPGAPAARAAQLSSSGRPEETPCSQGAGGGVGHGAEAALKGPSPLGSPRTWCPTQPAPLQPPLTRPRFPSAASPTLTQVLRPPGGRTGEGDAWHPGDRSVSPAESSLRRSRFSMGLLCSLLEAS